MVLTSASLLGVDNRGYYPEDWVSYTQTRFIRSISVGFYNVYFGTPQGILVYDMNMKKWLDPITRSDGLPDHNIEKIAVDPDDSRIWVITPSGFYKYESAFEEWLSVDGFPYELYHNDQHLIRNLQTYIPPFGYHLFAPDIIQDPNLREYSIITAVENSAGDFWLGTWGAGIGYIENYGVDFDLLSYGLYNPDCRAIHKLGDKMYFGGRSEFGGENALTIWDRDEDKWEYIESRLTDRFSSDYINDISAAGKYIFLATDYGLVRYNPDNGNFQSYTAPRYIHTDLVLSLEYHRGHLFFGTDLGLYDFDLKNDSINFLGSGLTANTAILDIKYYKGDLWLGTDHGALRYDFEARKFYRYATTGGVLLGIITDIESDTDNGLWFAGEDAIIYMDDYFKEQERFTVELDLDGFMPTKFIITKRYLWVGTDYGLYRYDRMKNYWKHYTVDDGLIDNQIFDLLLEDDYLWIATAYGVTRFYWNNPVRGEDF